MPKLYIMSGVGFSGKSTLAKKIAEYTGATLVSQDGLFFEKEKEWKIDHTQRLIRQDALANDYDRMRKLLQTA